MPVVSGVRGAVTTTKSDSRQELVQPVAAEHLVDVRRRPRVAAHAEHPHVEGLGLEREVLAGVAERR